MKKISVAIIEDEYPAMMWLEKLLKELRPEWEIALLPDSVEEAVDWFECHNHPELIFMDINLTDGDSFRLIEEAQPQSVIIFTTAFDDYALQAFEVNSIDYLLKPFSRERLEQSIIKYEKLYATQESNRTNLPSIQEALKALQDGEKNFRSRVLISINQKLMTIKVSDIAYFYFEERTTYAVTFDGRKYIIDSTLYQLEKELDPDIFFRVNRQYILSVHSIQRIEPYFNNRYNVYAKPENPTNIVVSREKISQLKSWLSY